MVVYGCVWVDEYGGEGMEGEERVVKWKKRRRRRRKREEGEEEKEKKEKEKKRTWSKKALN